MSLRAPMSKIPVRNRNDSGGHARSYSMPSKLEQMQIALQARIQRENFQKLARDKEERMLQVYANEQERTNRQISKYGYGNNSGKKGSSLGSTGTNVGGVRSFFQTKRRSESGMGVQGKPPLPVHHHKNSAGRDRANPLAPLNYRSPQVDYDDAGILGQGGSPTGIRHSPKPHLRGKPRGRSQRHPNGTPYDSGNESSGYEEQTFNGGNTYKVNKKRPGPPINQYQASSEEDVNTPSQTPTSFQQWKQTQGANKKKPQERKTQPNTALHNGYNSDAPMSEFQKFQAEQDQERHERLSRHQQKQAAERDDFGSSPTISSQPDVPRTNNPNSYRSNASPSTRRMAQQTPSQYDSEEERSPQSVRSNSSKASSAAMERNAKLEAELKKKEQELRDMIEKQQQQLTSMKLQREKEEAKEALEARRLAEEQERKKKSISVQKPDRKKSESGQTSQAPDLQPSPPPGIKPPILRKARRVKAPPPLPIDTEESFYDTTNAAQFYKDAVNNADAIGVQVELVPCSLCGRRFAAERIEKHQVSCQKAQAGAAKRKTFDVSKMRTTGTEMAQYAGKNRPEPKKADTGDWRKKREDFIQALQYAKKVTEVEKKGGKVADLPPPPRTENAHYKQCPYCERRFAPDTAERHIPKCKDTRSRPAPPRSSKMKRRGR